MQKHSPHLFIAHGYWKKHLEPGDIAIDATCGKGNDTLMLAQILLSTQSGQIFGLDLQQSAIDQTAALLKNNLPDSHFTRISLKLLCHSEIDQLELPASPRLIVYNLGYLPGGDKTITTRTATTLQSLQKALNLIAPDGAISVTCYPGHKEGEHEEKELITWAEKLSSAQWQICHHRWINRRASPSLLWIRSLG